MIQLLKLINILYIYKNAFNDYGCCWRSY
jgi:hypothetical protein